MKKTTTFHFLIISLALLWVFPSYAENAELKHLYELHCQIPSDINEHLPHLRSLAMECDSVVEIGVRKIVSTWALLQGLSESPLFPRSYIGIDLVRPPRESLDLAMRLAQETQIAFQFWVENDMNIALDYTDLLFIDSLHTYCHLSYELETFSPYVQKFIALHDTSRPWGYQDDTEYHGDYSEYPPEIDRTKRGLWPAVQDFLARHPEWRLRARYLNNHGFTILERINPQKL